MDYDDYTVGWICALPFEMATAISMLDEEHEALPMKSQDSNAYVLGRIGNHNVVISCLPAGQVGTASAANAAIHLISSFPRVRFGLMVGTGSGIPAEHLDIRLGDVVVSQPSGTHGGVVQYDFGRSLADGRFTRTGSLSKPPAVLRAAVAKLQAKHLTQESDLLRYISDSQKLYPTLKERYRYPGADNDRLFRSEYQHQGTNANCSLCDNDMCVPRFNRSSTAPAIHYGGIASGNVVMKDAMTRDQLAADLGIICIEMEAAGLMDLFPCLVIRGICDYADSHKNKAWQYYAALNAAAYAKELIYTIPAQAVQATNTVANDLELDIGKRESFEPVDQGSETSSQKSMTMVDEPKKSLINTAAEEVAHVLASDSRLSPLCTIGAVRKTPPVFRRILSDELINLGKAIRKRNKTTAIERAVAWILIHRKDLIAFTIHGKVAPSQDYTATNRLRLDQIPTHEKELLQRFINDEFAGSLPKTFKESRLEGHDPDDETQEQVDVERDDDGPLLELSTLAEPHNFQQILCSGEIYWEVYKRLKLLIFPAPIQELEKVLRRHLSRRADIQVVTCLIEWELLAYMDSESVTEAELDSVFTITGNLDRAHATRLGDYMSRRWANGIAVLDTIKSLIGPFVSENRTGDRGMPK
jgi:nucleoside phosphorylase